MSEEADDLYVDDITDEELKVILVAHQTWLESDGKEGKRADLKGMVDLMGGRLAGANLAGAIMPPNLKRSRVLTHVRGPAATWSQKGHERFSIAQYSAISSALHVLRIWLISGLKRTIQHGVK